jgi:hypothetical protein
MCTLTNIYTTCGKVYVFRLPHACTEQWVDRTSAQVQIAKETEARRKMEEISGKGKLAVYRCVCVCVCVCVFVCVCVCVCVCSYVYVYLSCVVWHKCKKILYIRMYTYDKYKCKQSCDSNLSDVCMHVCMYVCVCVCVCVCVSGTHAIRSVIATVIMHAYMHVSVCLCNYACIYACECVSVYQVDMHPNLRHKRRLSNHWLATCVLLLL